MLPESRFTAAPDVNAKVLEAEAVLLNVKTGAYFSMNKVGTHIWELYGAGRSLSEVVAGVCERFEVTPERAEADVRAFTAALLERGLLQTA